MKAIPKRPKKTKIIPKNRTGSGRPRGNLETIKFESENADGSAASSVGEDEEDEDIRTSDVEARKAARLTQKAVAERLRPGDGRRLP
jgi:hypothetical protein